MEQQGQRPLKLLPLNKPTSLLRSQVRLTQTSQAQMSEQPRISALKRMPGSTTSVILPVFEKNSNRRLQMLSPKKKSLQILYAVCKTDLTGCRESPFCVKILPMNKRILWSARPQCTYICGTSRCLLNPGFSGNCQQRHPSQF